MRLVRRLLVCGTVVSSAYLMQAPTASAGAYDFAGSWTSTDTDGSHQTLTVRPGGPARRSATLYDDAASICSGAPASVNGPATVDGPTLSLSGALRCRPGGNPFRGRISITWTYDSGTDTLTDQFDVTWQRST